MLEISEQKAILKGWDNMAQMEYFSNLEKYEDLSFVDRGGAGGSQLDMKSYNPNNGKYMSLLYREGLIS